MFIIKKIITPFLLPPGIFIVILILSGICLFFKKNWKTGILNCLIGVSMWLISIVPVSDFMLKWLEYGFNIPEIPSGDVIILLGGGAYDRVPDMSGTGTPSEDMLMRIVTTVRLQKRLNLPVIISTGKVFEHRISEAPIARRFLIDLGVPANKIILEDKSRDTIENAKYSERICRKLGYKNPVLVTSAYHMRRSVMSFEKAGIKVVPFPAGFKTWDNKKYEWDSYLPNDFRSAYVAFHEYVGLLFYTIAY